MTNFKVTISDVKGKSMAKELKDSEANPFLGLNLGSELDAVCVGLKGKIKITGGSDKSGIPMRIDIHGSARKFILLSKGIGLQSVEKGQRVRKLMRGNLISEEIYQLNCKYSGELSIESPPSETPTSEQVSEKKE